MSECDKCKIQWEEKYYIELCPLHAAAEDMLRVLKAFGSDLIGRAIRGQERAYTLDDWITNRDAAIARATEEG